MPDLEAGNFVSEINKEIGGPCQLLDHIGPDVVIEIQSSQLYQTTNYLLHQYEPIHLSTITADFEIKDPDYLQVYYHFWKKNGYTFRVRIAKDNPELDSIINLIPGADFYEREAAEMFGINFLNRESTPPLLLPDDFQGKPPLLFEREE